MPDKFMRAIKLVHALGGSADSLKFSEKVVTKHYCYYCRKFRPCRINGENYVIFEKYNSRVFLCWEPKNKEKRKEK
jgi:hypothetical protein